MKHSERRISCVRAGVLLDAYLDGELPPRRREQLESHLASCYPCTQELEQARRVRDTLRSLPERFCGDEVVQAVEARVRREPRGAAATGTAWGERLRRWFGHRLVPAWQPAAAALGVVAVVLGVTHFVLRPPAEKPITPQDVARAEVQVRWVMARLSDISRRTGAKVRDDVLDARVMAPTARAVENALEGNVTQ